jgi:hypothetical protein
MSYPKEVQAKKKRESLMRKKHKDTENYIRTICIICAVYRILVLEGRKPRIINVGNVAAMWNMTN